VCSSDLTAELRVNEAYTVPASHVLIAQVSDRRFC
jgi:hypothetical protein